MQIHVFIYIYDIDCAKKRARAMTRVVWVVVDLFGELAEYLNYVQYVYAGNLQCISKFRYSLITDHISHADGLWGTGPIDGDCSACFNLMDIEY